MTYKELSFHNLMYYVGQGYPISIHTKNWVSGCIFQIWPLFDLQWHIVTSNDFWGQNAIAYVGRDILCWKDLVSMHI